MALMEIQWRPDRRQLRTFGWIGCGAFLALGAWSYFGHALLFIFLGLQAGRAVGLGLWGAALCCGVLALAAPSLLRPLYVGLMVLSWPIGFALTHLIMAILFYGLFTPIALVFKLAGRDVLSRRFEPEAASYWTPRRQVADRKRYFQQF